MEGFQVPPPLLLPGGLERNRKIKSKHKIGKRKKEKGGKKNNMYAFQPRRNVTECNQAEKIFFSKIFLVLFFYYLTKRALVFVVVVVVYTQHLGRQSAY